MASIFYNNVEYGAGGGHEIYYGTTIPASSLGSSGDGYCRLDANGNLIEEYIKLGSNWTLVPKSDAVLGTKTITQNGTYPALTDSLDGFSSVDVNVSGGGSTLITKTVTQNGTYNAEDDNADGYSQFTVNVSGGGGVTAQQLVYGHQESWNDGSDPDSGITPMTLTTYNDYSEYLEYIAPTSPFNGYPDGAGAFRVKKSFFGLITPWVVNQQSSGSGPNGYCDIWDGVPNASGSTIKNQYHYRANNGSGDVEGITDNYGEDNRTIPYLFDVDDYIYIYSLGGTGWPVQHVKIYKVCDVNSNISTFISGTKTLDNNDTVRSVNLI